MYGVKREMWLSMPPEGVLAQMGVHIMWLLIIICTPGWEKSGFFGCKEGKTG